MWDTPLDECRGGKAIDAAERPDSGVFSWTFLWGDPIDGVVDVERLDPNPCTPCEGFSGLVYNIEDYRVSIFFPLLPLLPEETVTINAEEAPTDVVTIEVLPTGHDPSPEGPFAMVVSSTHSFILTCQWVPCEPDTDVPPVLGWGLIVVVEGIPPVDEPSFFYSGCQSVPGGIEREGNVWFAGVV